MRSDPLATRARRWARWRRHRAGIAWRRVAQLDVLTDEARTLWVCSWQRSGSTLLAQVLASAPGTRLIYEPANVPGGIFTGEDAAKVPLPTGPGPELASIERSLQGRVRGPWVDQLAHAQVVHRRVVKDVRATGLLGVVTARHPTTAVVVLVRHPLAIARSAVELGWVDGARDEEERLLGEVRRWAALHAQAFAAPTTNRALVVAYEHLVLDPDVTLDAVRSYLVEHHPTWGALAIDRVQVAAPSATSFRRGAPRDPREWVGTFDDVPVRLRELAAAVIRDAGLGALYGDGPQPLVGPADVPAAARGR